MNIEMLAPVIDRHASITIKERKGPPPRYELRFRLTYPDGGVLGLIQKDYVRGGYLHRQKGHGRADGTWILELTGAQAARLLEPTEPYLIKKASQAALALKFQHHKRRQVGGESLSANFLKTEQEMCEKMRQLNSSLYNSRLNVMYSVGKSPGGESESYLEGEDDGKSRIQNSNDGKVGAMRHSADAEGTITMYKGKKKMIIDTKTNRIIGGDLKATLW